MKKSVVAWFFICLVVTVTCPPATLAAGQNTLIARLKQSRAVNIETIVSSQFDKAEVADGFRVVNPYKNNTAEDVQTWMESAARAAEVCAIRFLDTDRSSYELRRFDSAAAATHSGFTITHQGRCGSCSTLEDLAVYLSTPDMTTPARQCARRFGLKRKKQCFQEHVGLTPYCAESWAYNAMHTRQECMGACIADYGLINLILNRYPGPNTDEEGQLRSCLECDEKLSGSGFKYSAGRTRRNSGIKSAIARSDWEIFPVDHSAYYP